VLSVANPRYHRPAGRTLLKFPEIVRAGRRPAEWATGSGEPHEALEIALHVQHPTRWPALLQRRSMLDRVLAQALEPAVSQRRLADGRSLPATRRSRSRSIEQIAARGGCRP
jgi:hypothetical protein